MCNCSTATGLDRNGSFHKVQVAVEWYDTEIFHMGYTAIICMYDCAVGIEIMTYMQPNSAGKYA